MIKITAFKLYSYW